MGRAPANLIYAPIDFAREGLGEALRRAGFQPARKTYYLCEGVSMYVPEEGTKQTLRAGLKIVSPESVKRYATRQDGAYYGAHLEKVFQQRREAALSAMNDADRQKVIQAAATSRYWLTELTVPQRPEAKAGERSRSMLSVRKSSL